MFDFDANQEEIDFADDGVFEVIPERASHRHETSGIGREANQGMIGNGRATGRLEKGW